MVQTAVWQLGRSAATAAKGGVLMCHKGGATTLHNLATARLAQSPTALQRCDNSSPYGVAMRRFRSSCRTLVMKAGNIDIVWHRKGVGVDLKALVVR